MNLLKNKVAVITGSSSGIGSSIAYAFANEGANVVVNYRESKDKASKVVDNIIAKQQRAISVQANMRNRDDIDRLIKTTLDEFGNIDIWVNNAGADILTGKGACVDNHEKLDGLIEVDLKGTINSSWAVTPVMQKQGNGIIINMGWDLSLHGFEGVNPQIFAATKAGILGFTRCLAKSIAPDIRVNAILPGWISTSFAKDVMDSKYYKARVNEIPLARFGLAKEVAALAVFLASGSSSYITGEAIKINGGLV